MFFLSKLKTASCVRSTACWLLLGDEEAVCSMWLQAKQRLETWKIKHEVSLQNPLKLNDSLLGLSVEHLKELFKQEGKEKWNLEAQLSTFKNQLQTNYLELDPTMLDRPKQIDFSEIKDPLQQLCWQEQHQSFTSKSHGHRWHPVVLRFAILQHNKDKASLLRKISIIKVPGSSTPGEYIQAVKPGKGLGLT